MKVDKNQANEDVLASPQKQEYYEYYDEEDEEEESNGKNSKMTSEMPMGSIANKSEKGAMSDVYTNVLTNKQDNTIEGAQDEEYEYYDEEDDA